MFAQLDLWRSAALESSALPVLSSDINVLSENKKNQQDTQMHHGINTSPIAVSTEVTMSRNVLSPPINASVQTPPPLSALQSPQPYQLGNASLLCRSPDLGFESPNVMEHNIPNKQPLTSRISATLVENQLPDISTLQSPSLKTEKFDIYDVLNMLDTGNDKPTGIKKEHHSSGPPQYPVYSQPSSSSYDHFHSVIISTASNTTSHGTQPYITSASSFQPQTLRSPTQLVYSSGLTNRTGGNILITPSSMPPLQIINTSTTISSQQQESTQQKQERSVMPTHQLSQLLPPPYPGTMCKTIMDQSTNQQTVQQLQKPFLGHTEAKLQGHADDDDNLEEEDMDHTARTTQVLTPAVTISPVSVSAVAIPNISGRTTTNIHLWQFIKELLLHPELHSSSIHWVERETGIFKIVDSVRVATLWGKRKNRPAMNYDKLSRSLRQYYKKGIMKKTERTQRLVYQFCHPYHL